MSNSIGKAVQGKNGVFVILIGMLTLVLVFMYMKKKKRKVMKEPPLMSHHIQPIKTDETIISKEQTEKDVAIRNEIRQALIQWEKGLEEHKRRKPYETIQQWFLRIKKSSSVIAIYEKVRYGEKSYTIEDVEDMKSWMRKPK